MTFGIAPITRTSGLKEDVADGERNAAPGTTTAAEQPLTIIGDVRYVLRISRAMVPGANRTS